MRFLLAGILLSLALSSYAQSEPVGQAYLVGMKKSDRVGKKSAYPDTKPDVVFSLHLNPRSNQPAVTEIRIRTVSGPPGLWSSTGSPPAAYLGVADARRPSLILNPKGGPLNVDSRTDGNLLLFVTGDGRFGVDKREFEVKLTLADNTTAVIPVSEEAAPSPEAGPAAPGAHPVRMSAFSRGLSRYDAVGEERVIKGDNRPDGLFILIVEASNRTITGVQIRSSNGIEAVWDTVPGSPNPPIGVAPTSDPVRLLNKRDGSVRIPVRDRVELNLYVADNGSIRQGETKFRITVTFADGGIAWTPVTQRDREPSRAAPPARGSETKVNFLGTWLGYVSTDAVGPYPELKPDQTADAVFGLDIEISPPKIITGIEIHSLVDPSRKWGTGGTGKDRWGLAVAYQNAPRKLLNRQDGSVRIPVETRSQFYLYASDPGDIKKTGARMRMIVRFADGSSYQQFVRRPVATTSTVVPGSGDLPKAKGIITCEFRGFIADLLSTSTRAGKDGYLDGTFIMKLKIDDKKLTKVVIRGTDGSVRWSSDPKAPVMLLGVALYPKIYNLVNPKGGPLSVPISGRRTIYLYAADNGLLSDPNSRLTVEATFSDKSTLTTDVIK